MFSAALVCEEGAQVVDAEEVGVGVGGAVCVVAPGAVDVDGVGFGERGVAFDDDEVFVVATAGGVGEVVAAGEMVGSSEKGSISSTFEWMIA